MKYIVLTFLIIFVRPINAQETENGTDVNVAAKCEEVSLNAANILVSEWPGIIQGNTFIADGVIAHWKNNCGTTEIIQRTTMMMDLLEQKLDSMAITFYFESYFHEVLYSRLNDSKAYDYGEIYKVNKEYYAYLPLRHTLDSLIQETARTLLLNKQLSPDEELLCLMFSGNTKKFSDTLYSKAYKGTYIREYLRLDTFQEKAAWFNFNMYAGTYIPLGKSDIFPATPTLGFTIGSPMQYRFLAEIGVKLRMNFGDKDFQYYALDTLNNVNSKISMFLGVTGAYKLYESLHLICLSKVGLGLESVGTGLSEVGETEEDIQYYNAETVHLNGALCLLFPLRASNYLGLELNYHYTPYQLDKNLKTDFNNSAFSIELTYKF